MIGLESTIALTGIAMPSDRSVDNDGYCTDRSSHIVNDAAATMKLKMIKNMAPFSEMLIS